MATATAADVGDKGAGGISEWLANLRDSVTDISSTGVTILKTQQTFKNTIADNKNQDALNATIASYASPTAATEVARARREALSNAGVTGSNKTQFGNSGTLLIIGAVAVAIYLTAKKA